MEESDTTVVFNVLRDDDVILERNVSVRVSAKPVTAGGNKKGSSFELEYIMRLVMINKTW